MPGKKVRNSQFYYTNIWLFTACMFTLILILLRIRGIIILACFLKKNVTMQDKAVETVLDLDLLDLLKKANYMSQDRIPL